MIVLAVVMCQSFRNQGPGYTHEDVAVLVQLKKVSILQKSRTWLHFRPVHRRAGLAPVSILQKSRTWLHRWPKPSPTVSRVCVNPSEIKDLVTLNKKLMAVMAIVVSILQKSRTWLHSEGHGGLNWEPLCQSFRNQGPGYTLVPQAGAKGRICVNPSEIKDLVTPPRQNYLPSNSFCVNPSEIKDLVTPRADAPHHAGLLCQSFRNQGPGYTPAKPLGNGRRFCVNPSEIKDLVTPSAKIPSEYQRVTTPFCLAGVNFVKRNIENRDF